MEKPLAKKDNLILLNWFKAFSIDLNALNIWMEWLILVLPLYTIVFFDIVVHPHQWQGIYVVWLQTWVLMPLWFSIWRARYPSPLECNWCCRCVQRCLKSSCKAEKQNFCRSKSKSKMHSSKKKKKMKTWAEFASILSDDKIAKTYFAVSFNWNWWARP